MSQSPSVCVRMQIYIYVVSCDVASGELLVDLSPVVKFPATRVVVNLQSRDVFIHSHASLC